MCLSRVQALEVSRSTGGSKIFVGTWAGSRGLLVVRMDPGRLYWPGWSSRDRRDQKADMHNSTHHQCQLTAAILAMFSDFSSCLCASLLTACHYNAQSHYLTATRTVISYRCICYSFAFASSSSQMLNSAPILPCCLWRYWNGCMCTAQATDTRGRRLGFTRGRLHDPVVY